MVNAALLALFVGYNVYSSCTKYAADYLTIALLPERESSEGAE